MATIAKARAKKSTKTVVKKTKKAAANKCMKAKASAKQTFELIHNVCPELVNLFD